VEYYAAIESKFMKSVLYLDERLWVSLIKMWKMEVMTVCTYNFVLISNIWLKDGDCREEMVILMLGGKSLQLYSIRLSAHICLWTMTKENGARPTDKPGPEQHSPLDRLTSTREKKRS
jgi:hypothetical protein